MKPDLVIFSTDAKLIEKLRSYRPPFVTYAIGDGPSVAKALNLDALKVSMMESLERFGWDPPYPPFEARVLKTPPQLIEKGLPKYAISGVALPNNHPRDPWFELEVTVSAMLRAVNDFNADNDNPIVRIGLVPQDLNLHKLPPAEVFQRLVKLYEEPGSPGF